MLETLEEGRWCEGRRERTLYTARVCLLQAWQAGRQVGRITRQGKRGIGRSEAFFYKICWSKD